jgi:hypothetical protein
MSTKSYQSDVGELTVRPVPTVSRSGETNAVALIGGYNASTAESSVTAGEATAVTNPLNASEQFGNSEIARAATVLTANGANDIRAVPVPETEMTDSGTGTDSITLSHAPIFDPQLHPEHDIEVVNSTTSEILDVNYVYTDPVQSPTTNDTANVNPVTGSVVTDVSSDYEVTYTYGDYQSAIDTAKDLPVRYLCVLTENEGVKASAIAAVADIASDYDLKFKAQMLARMFHHNGVGEWLKLHLHVLVVQTDLFGHKQPWQDSWHHSQSVLMAQHCSIRSVDLQELILTTVQAQQQDLMVSQASLETERLSKQSQHLRVHSSRMCMPQKSLTDLP